MIQPFNKVNRGKIGRNLEWGFLINVSLNPGRTLGLQAQYLPDGHTLDFYFIWAMWNGKRLRTRVPKSLNSFVSDLCTKSGVIP